MQRALLSISALVALLAALWFVMRDDGAAPAEGALVAIAPTPAEDGTAPAELAPAHVAADAARTLVSVVEPAHEPSGQLAPEATCIVVGRVVDVDRRPVVDADVRLSAYEEWAEGHDIPRIDDEFDMRGFVTRTDAAGAFRFVITPPTNPRQRLTLAADPFLDSFTAYFGEGSRDRRPGFAAGETDLGELVLAVTGAVSGRVVDERGAPLAGAKVGLGTTSSTTYSRDTRTRADGTYLVPHAPIGAYGVKVEATGFLNAFVSPVTVEARRETTGIDVTLAAAESIQGTVRDEQGLPIAGASLSGWPMGSGRGASAKSGDDGTFTMFLPQTEPYTLTVTLDGYERWGDKNDKQRVFEPGVRDLSIVLKSIERIHVSVVDDATDVRLQRFGINVLEDNGSRSAGRVMTEQRRPADKEHADGVALVTARSGVDLLVAAADGYLLTAVDAEAGEGSPPTQTIRLRRAPVVRGRALRDGAPLADVAVELVGGRMDSPDLGPRRVDPGSPAARVEAPRTPQFWFRPERNGARTTRTDAEGRFALAPERPEELRLSIDAGPGWSLVRAPLRASGEADLDLGDLHADVSGRIEGTVLVPSGVAPEGLKVHIGDWVEGAVALVDVAGHFVFDDLAPGHHLLTLDDRPGVLAGSAGVLCEVLTGEATTITLDARDKGMCELVLAFGAAGIDLVGQQVSVPDPSELFGYAQLGKVGEDGVARGSVRAFGEATVHLPSLGIKLTDQPLELVPFERIERTLRLSLGSLELRWPRNVTLREGAGIQFDFAPLDEGTATQTAFTKIVSDPSTRAPTRADLAGANLDRVVAGRSRLTVTVTDPKERIETKLPDGRIRGGPLVLLETVVEIVISPGELTKLQL